LVQDNECLGISVKSNSNEKQYSIEEQKQEVSIQELKELNEWRENKHLKDFMLHSWSYLSSKKKKSLKAIWCSVSTIWLRRFLKD
jgi:hypothetical protein